jgi:hypothetical protein
MLQGSYAHSLPIGGINGAIRTGQLFKNGQNAGQKSKEL